MATDYNLANIGSGVLLTNSSVNSGSGNYSAFLRIQNTGIETGYNTDLSKIDNNKDGNFTHSVLLSSLAIVNVGGVDYYEVRLDLNESGSKDGPAISLDDLQIFSSAAAAGAPLAGDDKPTFAGAVTKVYDLDGSLALTDHANGSGTDDYQILVPTSLFTDKSGYMTLYADFSGADAGFEEFRAAPAVAPPTPPEHDPAITVVKTANPTSIDEGSAHNVTYTYTLTSQSDATDPLTITSLVDDNGTASTGDDINVLTSGTFVGGDTNGNHLLDSNETWTYTYTEGLSLNPSQSVTNTVTVNAHDDEGVTATDTATATVTGADVKPAITLVKDASVESIDEGSGSSVTYTYTLTSQSVSTDPLSITSLIDDNGTPGDTSDDVNILTQGTLVSGDTNNNHKLDAGESWVYSYTRTGISLDAGSLTNTAVVHATDDEGNDATSHDDATVTINDVKPAITIVKSADPQHVNEGTATDVTYTYTVTSQSASTDPLTITKLVDDNGTAADTSDDVNLLTQGTFVSGDSNNNGKLDSNETWVFEYTRSVGASMNAGDTLTNKVTIDATDDEGNKASDNASSTVTADATVVADNVDPKITLDKSVDKAHVNEGTATDVVYTYTLTSQSASTDPLTVTSLVDDHGTADTSDDVNLLAGASGTNLGNYYVSGDDNHNGLLDSNETWVFQFSTSVGASMDANDTLTNSATVTAKDDDVGSKEATSTDTATVTADDVKPGITLVKSADKNSINEGTASDITYTYTLTSQSVSTDPLKITSLVDDNGTASTADDVNVLTQGTYVSGDTNNNGKIDSTETWVYTYTAHNVVVDAKDGPLVNTAVVHATDDENNDTSSTAQASVAINDLKPGVDVTKAASVSTVQAGVPTPVTFTYTVTNQSAVSTDPLKIDSLTDDNGTAGNTSDDVNLLTHYVSGDSNNNGLVDKGETWTFSWTTNVTATGPTMTNVVSVVAHDDENNSVNDTASATINATNFFHSPGFWSNNGALLWDGNGATMPKSGTQGIVATGGDLAYAIKDLDGNGVADTTGAGAGAGSRGYLMIGDWNKNGVADNGENVLVISYADAMSLLNASTKQQGDARFVLARDEVAAWLNYLSGSYVGSSSSQTSTRHYLDEANAWLMQTTTDHNHVLTVSELTSASAIAQSNAAWGMGFDGTDANTVKGENQVPVSGDIIGGGLDIMAGNSLHTGLDHYNNSGWIF